MSSKTKIVVLKSKELIYTGIFIILGILLILLMFYMFSPGDGKSNSAATNESKEIIPEDSISTQTSAMTKDTGSQNKADTSVGYTPGVYTSQLNLGGSNLQLSVTVDKNQVTGVSIDNLDESLTAMYPLVQPSLDEINSQIGMVSSVDDITYSSDNKYTTIILLEAIDDALENARK